MRGKGKERTRTNLHILIFTRPTWLKSRVSLNARGAVINIRLFWRISIAGNPTDYHLYLADTMATIMLYEVEVVPGKEKSFHFAI